MPRTVLVVCLFPETGLDAPRRAALADAVRATYRQHFGAALTPWMVWVGVPPGQSFVAGEPSAVTSVMAPVPDALANPARHRFMHALSAAWLGATGGGPDSLVVNAPDRRAARAFMAASNERLAAARRPRVLARLLGRWAWTRLRDGQAVASINLSA